MTRPLRLLYTIDQPIERCQPMTRGDMVYNQVTLLNGQYMDINFQSTSGIEWMINNIIIPFGYT